MNPTNSAEPTVRVAVFAAPDGIDELSHVLSDVLGLHPTDAAIHARGMPGILPDSLPREKGAQLVAGINRIGLHAELVPSGDVPALDHVQPVHHLRCLDSGLEVLALHGEREAIVPWQDIELICVGVIPQEVTKHYLSGEMATLSAARRTTHLALELPLSEGPELWIGCRQPFRAFRIDHKRMNYEYLGERKTDSATVNFRSLLEDILRQAPQAYLTPSTRAYIGHGAEKLYRFESTDALSHYLQFHILVQRQLQAAALNSRSP